LTIILVIAFAETGPARRLGSRRFHLVHLDDFSIASIVVSGVITTVLIAAVYWIDSRRRPAEPGPPPLMRDVAAG
jgi:hypothetical protein